MEKIKVNSIEQAEQCLQDARECCQRGDIKNATELFCEITAFYERSKIKGRIKACHDALDRLLKTESDFHKAFEILDNLALGPGEQRYAVLDLY